MERFEFRQVRPDEWEELGRIEAECFPASEACKPEIMKIRVEIAPELILVAVERENGKLVGFIDSMATDEEILRDEFFTDPSLHDPNGKNVMVQGVTVRPVYQHQGIARAMMKEYVAACRNLGKRRIVLTCVEGKISMYAKFGYRDLGESASSWGGEKWHEMDYVLEDPGKLIPVADAAGVRVTESEAIGVRVKDAVGVRATESEATGGTASEGSERVGSFEFSGLRYRISDSCAKCLYDKRVKMTDDETYHAYVRDVLNHRKPSDTTPLLGYIFNQVFEKNYGNVRSYKEINRKYNDLVLSMEAEIRKKIEAADDPIREALGYSRIGNYIDFGAMMEVSEETFLSLFDHASLRAEELRVTESLIEQCAKARDFLLITDNCGEIVLDKLFLEQIHKRFPKLKLRVLVRGGEAINDATRADAEYVGLGELAEIIDNGMPIAGSIYELMPGDVQKILNETDVVLAKGQANFESLSGQGRHIFYSFLCKCDYFMKKFAVPKLTGMFIEEN